MADAIVYCDACGRMIPPGELARGLGLVSERAALCQDCLGRLSPEQRSALASPSPGAGPVASGATSPKRQGESVGVRPAKGRRTPSPSGRTGPVSPSRTRVLLAVAGVAAGLLAGAAVGLVLTRGPGPQPAPSPAPQRTLPAPVAWGPGLPAAAARPEGVPSTEGAAEGVREPAANASREAESRPLQPSRDPAEESRRAKEEAERLAEKELSEAVSRSEKLAADGRFGEALDALSSAAARFASSEYFAARGRNLVEEAQRRVRTAREAAEAEAAEKERSRAREDAWREFARAFVEAGAGGIGRARELVEKELPRLRELGLEPRLAWLESRIREAQAIESLVEDGVRGAKGPVRLRWNEKPVSGTVVKVEGGRLTLRPVLGQEIELPLAEAAPLPLVQAAGLLRSGAEAGEVLRVASYLLVRGDLDSAAKAIAELAGPRAEDFRRRLAELAAAQQEEKPPSVARSPESPASAVAAAQAPPAPAGEDVTEGLLAYFRFDEGQGTSVFDEPGTGAKRDSGSIQGNGTEGTHWSWVEGKFGKALSFSPDRSGGVGKEVFCHVALADGEIRWIHRGSHSLACWVRFPDRTPPPHGGGLVKAAGYNAGLGCRTDARGYYLQFVQAFDDDYKMIAAEDPQPRSGGVWIHAVGTCDTAARKMRLYVDGSLVDEKDFPSPGQSLTGGPNGWNIGANQPGTWWNDPVAAVIDEVRFYSRALTKDEVAEIYSRMDREIATVAKTPEERRLLMAQAVGKPASEGYSLDVRAIARLASALRKGSAVPKKLADVGGAVAASPSFGAAVRKALKTSEGYSFAPSTGLASSGLTLADARKGLWRHIERERPELVRLCFDATDLARGRPIAEAKADLAEIAEKLLERGSAVVLYTLPVREPQDEKARKLVLEYNAAVAEIASRLRVPLLDAYGILKSEAESGRNVFSPAGAVNQAGCDALNERFLRLYRVLERWAVARAPAEALP